MLKIGYIYYEHGDWERARATLKSVVAKFPDTNEGGFAQSRLDRMVREGH
jgi:TolA-binding protein